MADVDYDENIFHLLYKYFCCARHSSSDLAGPFVLQVSTNASGRPGERQWFGTYMSRFQHHLNANNNHRLGLKPYRF